MTKLMRAAAAAVMSLALLAGAALPAAAQTSRRSYAGRAPQVRRYEDGRRVYDRRYDRREDERSFFEKHRDKLTVAGGTAAGAVVGGLAGGKKGAIIGALVGAGGSALYTYKMRDRDDDRRYRY